MKKEKIPLVVIYEENGEIKIEHPENNQIPTYEIIGYLECYIGFLKEQTISNWRPDDEKV